MNRPEPYLLLTCEHGGNRIPAAYRHLFAGKEKVLESHRGHDPGSLELGRKIAAALRVPLFYSTTSRLLVELNRSLHHPDLFSEYTAPLHPDIKQTLLQKYYYPHRDEVEAAIRKEIDRGRFVFHLGLHSFTPVLKGKRRNADIGLLYDPDRGSEKRLCADWKAVLKESKLGLHVRCNYPYLGKTDGFTTYLRTRFTAEQYAGIEIELNQLWPKKERAEWKAFMAVLAESLKDLCSR